MEKGHWGSLENQRSFLDEVAARLDIQEASSDLGAWKSVTSEQFRALGGGGLLNKYGGSLYRLLSSAYPKIAGDSSSASRRKLPNGYWKDIDNRKRFFKEVAASHAVEKDEVGHRAPSEHSCFECARLTCTARTGGEFGWRILLLLVAQEC